MSSKHSHPLLSQSSTEESNDQLVHEYKALENMIASFGWAYTKDHLEEHRRIASERLIAGRNRMNGEVYPVDELRGFIDGIDQILRFPRGRMELIKSMLDQVKAEHTAPMFSQSMNPPKKEG